MAFNCSYRALNDYNIRHIYSDQKLRILFPKRTHFRSLQEELPVPPLRLYPKRFYDYYPTYKIGIPRAPAFRGTDPEHVEAIVRRICKPMKCEKERRHAGSNDYDDSSSHNSTPREEPETRRSAKDISELVSRLQRPTKSWELKKYDRYEREREKERAMKESSIPKLPPIPSRC